jgi:hypothetical protein
MAVAYPHKERILIGNNIRKGLRGFLLIWNQKAEQQKKKAISENIVSYQLI